MLRIILSGCNGGVGRVIAKTAKARKDVVIVAGIDPNTDMPDGFHVFPSPGGCGQVEADVILDFSHPSALDELLTFAVRRKIPAVIATTGLSEGHIASINEASTKIPVFFSANMSLGINLMVELCKTAVKVLGDGFDIEILEKHHNLKIDAPSGTALMIAKELEAAREGDTAFVYERESRREKRKPEEIGIHSVRAGTYAGEHEVIFAGRDEVLSITHQAMSKEIFAAGSLNAAQFIADKQPGLYNMASLIRQS